MQYDGLGKEDPKPQLYETATGLSRRCIMILFSVMALRAFTYYF